MQIQIITTHEEMQQLFDDYYEKAILSHKPNVNSKPAPFIVSGEDLSKQLGITIQTLIRWRQKGKIPYLQIGSSIRYDLNDVIAALEVSNKKKGLKNG